jgi:hypothetical protein
VCAAAAASTGWLVGSVVVVRTVTERADAQPLLREESIEVPFQPRRRELFYRDSDEAVGCWQRTATATQAGCSWCSPSIDKKPRQQTKDPFYFISYWYRQLWWDLFVTRDSTCT